MQQRKQPPDLAKILRSCDPAITTDRRRTARRIAHYLSIQKPFDRPKRLTFFIGDEVSSSILVSLLDNHEDFQMMVVGVLNEQASSHIFCSLAYTPSSQNKDVFNLIFQLLEHPADSRKLNASELVSLKYMDRQIPTYKGPKPKGFYCKS